MSRQTWLLLGIVAERVPAKASLEGVRDTSAPAGLLLMMAGVIACGPAVSDHDNRIFAAPAAVKLSAADLSMAYASDAGAADARYRGRVMEVSGVVSKVQPAPAAIMLAGGDTGPLVEASLHEDVGTELLKTIADGQRITIKCFCEGLNQRVRLKSCVAPGPGH